MKDEYRVRLTLWLNLMINLGYAIFKAVCGFVFHSAWMGTLAFYYMILSIIRFLLIKGMGHEDLHKKWKKYFQCGWFLLLFTIVLVGMGILIQSGKESINYPGYLIYGVAAYTFYAIIMAVRNVSKYRKINEPIYLASKVLNLAVAVVAVFSLQSALLSTFGDDPDFARIMGISTGFGAFLIVSFMAVRMIVRGYVEVKSNRQ